MAVCKNCNSELPEGAKFCMKCGTKVETELFCPQCGEKVPAGAAFCMKCGAKIGAAEAADGVSEEKKPEPEPKAAVQGDKIVVSPDGSTGYSTIQAAVDAASDGMMIEIMPGTYKENIKIGEIFGDKKHIALVGIADNSGKFPTITAANEKDDLIFINGNVNLYRLNLESGTPQEDDGIRAIQAWTDSFVYSEINFDGAITISPMDGSDEFNEDCEISNCNMTNKKVYIRCGDEENATDISASCDNEKTKNFIKVENCNFEKGTVCRNFMNIENCTLGVVYDSGYSDSAFCKNSTIAGFADYSQISKTDPRFQNCKFLS